ncbi:MAG: AAA family ATPase [Deltaproteobacteria bacterium]|nr:AAA family ATPase [Deltaproteobacteria bacterium]
MRADPSPTTPDAFVGRTRELGELRAGLRGVLGGSGRMFLLAGDPGVGKTRLSDEISRDAQAAGAQVVWGRCWEGGAAPPYWPWMQIFRRMAREGLLPDSARSLMTDSALVHLMHEGPDDALLPVHPPSTDLADQRFRLFDAATTLLERAAEARPLVLILDDLHAADQTSLLLLRFTARALRGNALLIVATYREMELRRVPALGQAVAELARDGRVLTLRGLSQPETAQLIETILGRLPDESLVGALHGATAGNPFFLSEIVRLMQAEGRFDTTDGKALTAFTLPSQLREAVRRQLDLLSPATAELMSKASVIGQQFSVPVLARVAADNEGEAPAAEVDHSRLIDLLDDAIHGRVIRCISVAGARYEFVHQLIREALYDAIAPSMLLTLHGRVGTALEALYGDAAERPLAELAHHYLHSGSIKGLEYADRTGDDALQRLAYEEAARWYEMALAALDRLAPDDTQRMLALRLGLGDASKGAADFEGSQREYRRAAELARSLRLPVEFARAVIGLSRPWMQWQPDHVLDSLQEEALRGLAQKDSRLRVQLMALRGANLYAGDRCQAVALITDSVAMARRLQNAPGLSLALLLERFRLGDEGRIHEALAIAAEAVTAAERAGDREIAFNLQMEEVKNYLWRGDTVGVDAATTRCRGLATLLRQPFCLGQVFWMDAMRAALEGHFDEAERCADRANAEENRAGVSSPVLTIFRTLLRRETGSNDVLDVEAKIPEEMIDVPQVRAMLAVLACDRGDAPTARFHLDRAAGRGFASLANDWNGSCAVAQLAEVAARLGASEHARSLYDALKTHAGLAVSFSYQFCLGAAGRYFGLLAATFGDWNLAARHFEAALAMNAAMGARPWLAHTQHEYAAAMARAWEANPAGDTPQSRAKAVALAREANATAQTLGMRPLLSQTTALLEQLATVPPRRAVQPRAVAESGGAFQRQGDVWKITYGGTTCQLKDMRGLAFIVHLLRHPGEDIHSTALVRLGDGADTQAQAGAAAATTEIRTDLGDAGEVLDHQARTAYRQRLIELRGELEQAEAYNDPGRSAGLRAEIASLTEELQRAVGLGGRQRRSGSHTERARVNATRAIAVAIQRIAEHNPALARHLSERIKTGTFCSYRANDERMDWNL